MKKYIKIFKRVLALLVIIIINVNTYATQTSNDGTTFVSKAEFDSLIDIFSNKKNDFESDINAKIDTAVANYLGGFSALAELDALMYINSIQSENVMRFKVWQDPGSTLTGRQIIAAGGFAAQLDGSNKGWGGSFYTSNNTGSTTNNKSRWYQKDFLGYSVYLGTCYPYIRTTWTLDGIFYFSSDGSGDIKIGNSRSYVGNFTRTAPNTTTTTTTRQQYWSQGSSSGWTNKYGYLTHGQAWVRAANDATDYYSVSANAVSTSDLKFVRDELRDTDDGMECTSSNRWSMSTNASNTIGVNATWRTINWNESLPFWTVKSENVKFSNLYNYILVAKGHPLKLYEGVPLFKATLTGNATIKMQVMGGSTDITFADLCISNSKFSNAVISSGNTMTSISPAYDKSKSSPTAETLKNVEIARVKSGDTVTIEMPVTIDETYYVKLMPRTSSTSTDVPAAGKYAYISKNMETIKIKAPKKDNQE